MIPCDERFFAIDYAEELREGWAACGSVRPGRIGRVWIRMALGPRKNLEDSGIWEIDG